MDYAPAWAYDRTRARQDTALPGSLVMAVPKASSSSILSSKKGVVHNVSAAMGVAEVVQIVTQVLAKAGGGGGVVHNINHTPQTPDICRDFQKGRCKRGDSCRFEHPTGNQGSKSSSGDKSNKKCYHCGKTGHFKHECNKLKAERAKQVALTQGRGKGDDDESLQDVNIEGAAYMAVHSVSSINFQDKTKAVKGAMLMVLDGEATIGIAIDEEQCEDVQEFEHVIKVGGEKGPTLIQARKKGVVRIDQLVDGRSVKFTVPVSICPGFGCNILPECLFLEKGFSVNKEGQVASVRTPDGKTLLYAQAKQHDDTWLFYTELRTDGSMVSPPSGVVTVTTEVDGTRTRAARAKSNTFDQVLCSHAVPCDEGEDEHVHVRFGGFDGVATVLATARSTKENDDFMMQMHRRYGHRNFPDVAKL